MHIASSQHFVGAYECVCVCSGRLAEEGDWAVAAVLKGELRQSGRRRRLPTLRLCCSFPFDVPIHCHKIGGREKRESERGETVLCPPPPHFRILTRPQRGVLLRRLAKRRVFLRPPFFSLISLRSEISEKTSEEPLGRQRFASITSFL